MKTTSYTNERRSIRMLGATILLLSIGACSDSNDTGGQLGSGGTTAQDGSADISGTVDGSDGMTGQTSASGSGADGVDGQTGLEGTDGSTASNASDGTVGGADGATGTDGLSGIDGSTGASSTGGNIGDHCQSAADCDGNVCITMSNGYCSQKGCTAGGCPMGSECFEFTNGDAYCLKLCSSNADCKSDQVCDADGTCWPGEPTAPVVGDGSIGSACTADGDCSDAGAVCYPENFNGEHTGFLNGYCIIYDCESAGCPTGSTCQTVTSDGGTACVASCQGTSDCRAEEGYACYQGGICFPGCGANTGASCPINYACDIENQECIPACTPGSCPGGTVCTDDGTCGEPPCTPGSCGTGLICADSGVCIPDLSGGPGVGPGPVCDNLPPASCSGSLSQCGEVTQFTPVDGPGYTNYPLNGETWQNQYRSFCREDLQVLIKWATAYVDCKAIGWGGGNGYPLGLGDMSEADGAIPGTSDGQPGHPQGTHVDGYDMDIAYYSNTGSNNYL
ncbi:MAG: hypothetical protein VX223_00305, partial [Myxococcota bacterium]|nr:hypothetical protein [Myxococcota bacterium]